jgi:hypothetical protein
MSRGRWRPIHTYVISELFGIPSDRWLSCVPQQTTANYEERVQIKRFVSRRQESRHPDPPANGEGKIRQP